MVSHRGIKANPDKIQAILDMKPPQNTKEIQSLIEQVAALNKFVSKATDKCLPFFKILKKAFEWTDECRKAFEDLKAYLTMAHLLSPSMLGEELNLYLAVTPHVVSSALIREEDKVQRPVYYTSKALRGVEGRLIQWAIELNEFNIRYQPRHAIKAQVLAYFIAEFTPNYGDLDEMENSKKWVVRVDGLSTRYAGGIDVVLQSPEGDKLKHKVRLQYQTINNEVEYEALLKGLELAKSVEAKSILVLGDSQLIIGQVNGIYEAKEKWMRKYLHRAMRLVKRFEEADFVQIPREENVEPDIIAKEASTNESVDEVDEIQYMPIIDISKVQQVESREN